MRASVETEAGQTRHHQTDAPEVLIDIREVCRQIGGFTPSTVYGWIRAGKFPEQRKLHSGDSRWLQSDVQAWIDALPRASEVAS